MVEVPLESRVADPIGYQALRILDHMLERFADPARQCSGPVAVDRFGRETPAYGPSAVAWCAMSNLYLSARELRVDDNQPWPLGAVNRAWCDMRLVSQRLYGKASPAYINDELGYDAIMHVMRVTYTQLRDELVALATRVEVLV